MAQRTPMLATTMARTGPLVRRRRTGMSFRPGRSWEVVTWAASRSRSGWAVRAEVAGESETRRSQGTSQTRGGRQPRL